MKGLILAAAGTLLIGLAHPVQALDVLSTSGSGPAGNCQPALPVYEGLVRKRPLAVVNEGAENAYVTCALTTEEVSLNVQSFGTRVSNGSDAALTVSCTAVVGDELATTSYIPKSIDLAPGAAGQPDLVRRRCRRPAQSKSIAMSCLLPPGPPSTATA